MIETHISAKRYDNYFDRIIKKTTIRVHYTMEKMSRRNVTRIYFQKAGFH